MTLEMVQSLLRHVLGLAGGYVIGKGWIDSGQWDLVLGLAMTASALGWSFFNKKALRAAPAVTD